MKILKNILWWLSPCRKCEVKDTEGLVACSCTKGLFEKKWKRRVNRNECIWK